MHLTFHTLHPVNILQFFTLFLFCVFYISNNNPILKEKYISRVVSRCEGSVITIACYEHIK